LRRAADAIRRSAARGGLPPAVGLREWDRRNYREPGTLMLRSLVDVARHPRWAFDVLVPHGIPRFENVLDSG
jgi:hypothetical protein